MELASAVGAGAAPVSEMTIGWGVAIWIVTWPRPVTTPVTYCCMCCD